MEKVQKVAKEKQKKQNYMLEGYKSSIIGYVEHCDNSDVIFLQQMNSIFASHEKKKMVFGES